MPQEQASPGGDGGRATGPGGDEERIAALRRGDEDAFRTLVSEHGPFLMRLALMHVSTR